MSSDHRLELPNDLRAIESAVAAIVISLGFLLLSFSLIASLVSMIKRMRRSHGVQRQQLRLMVTAVALVAK